LKLVISSPTKKTDASDVPLTVEMNSLQRAGRMFFTACGRMMRVITWVSERPMLRAASHCPLSTAPMPARMISEMKAEAFTTRAATMHWVSVSSKGTSLGRPIQKKYSWRRMGVPRRISTYTLKTVRRIFRRLIRMRATTMPSRAPRNTVTAEIQRVPHRPERYTG